MTNEEFCAEIVECLIRYGNLNKDDAQLILDESNLCNNNSELGWAMLEHEYPYFWAMNLIYGKSNPNWHTDPKLWPLPQDYIEKWFPTKR